MEPKYKERLLQVCRVLRELPRKKRFSLETWYKCGTVGCAIGWAATDPWFKRRGFKLRPFRVSTLLLFPGQYQPIYKNEFGLDAVQIFFGLNDIEARDLFFAMSYKRGTKNDVIRRVEAFAKAETQR